ncbi:uncharacterized protein ColSpa_09883 [Colletotrichum spaethianum]|uniref:Uncharacterized protein n=1 Tax=Colletotrichum spaethianum TaxID=700344 RepID=A0AA37PCJ1_9PEZI|nr:uncharacterized protein ColSpa_09883 [Colletotrichum spaethianum]GKT49702.1 hypothetical protein ColSpa_09883 [Colletotrichum spaethianum]
MDPSRKGEAPAAKVPDSTARDVQRQPIPVDGEEDDQGHQQWRQPDEAPPPYEPSSTGTAASTPSSSSRPSARESGDVDDPRSSRSSLADDDKAGLLAGKRGRRRGAREEGYLLEPRPRLSREREDSEEYTWVYPEMLAAEERLLF